MKKYSVYPAKTRALGNVVNNNSNPEDFTGVNCSPVLTGEQIIVENIEWPIFKIMLNRIPVILKVTGDFSINPDESTTLNIELTEEETGEFISNVDVYFYENNTLLGSSETVDGTCSFNYSSNIRGDHIILVKTNDELIYDAASTQINIYVFHTTTLGLAADSLSGDLLDTFQFTTTLLDEENNPVLDEAVNLYSLDELVSTAQTDQLGTAMFSPLTSAFSIGENKITAKFEPETPVQYLGSVSNELTLNLIKATPSIILTYPQEVYESGDVLPLTIKTVNKFDNPISLDFKMVINGEEHNLTTDEAGECIFNHTLASAVETEIEINTIENDTYLSTSVSEAIKVSDPTTLNLYSTTPTVSVINPIELSAVLLDSNSNPISEQNITFYEEDIVIGTGVTDSSGIASFNHSNTTIGEHTYKAVFESSGVYRESTSTNITVEVVKDTPVLTSLTSDIYSGWQIGAVLEDSNGNVLSSKPVLLTWINGAGNTYSFDLTTDDMGKCRKTVTGSVQSVDATYSFAGDDYYNPVSFNQIFNILAPMTASVCAGTNSKSGNDSVPYRKWDDVYNNCTDNYAECTNIATASGSYNRPAVLTQDISFAIPGDAVVTSLKAEWKSAQLPYSGTTAYPTIGAPTITISDIGTGQSHSHKDKAPGKSSWVSDSFTMTGAIASELNDGVKVKVNFPANAGGNMGKVRLYGVKLTATYTPAQGGI